MTILCFQFFFKYIADKFKYRYFNEWLLIPFSIPGVPDAMKGYVTKYEYSDLILYMNTKSRINATKLSHLSKKLTYMLIHYNDLLSNLL